MLGSPMGRDLYASLGYNLVGTATVRVDDEKDHVVIYIMDKVL